MKTSQYEVIGNLLKRKRGATTLELMAASNSTCIHKRMSEMSHHMGWNIWREPIKGKSYGRFFGRRAEA